MLCDMLLLLFYKHYMNRWDVEDEHNSSVSKKVDMLISLWRGLKSVIYLQFHKLKNIYNLLYYSLDTFIFPAMKYQIIPNKYKPIRYILLISHAYQTA